VQLAAGLFVELRSTEVAGTVFGLDRAESRLVSFMASMKCSSDRWE